MMSIKAAGKVMVLGVVLAQAGVASACPGNEGEIDPVVSICNASSGNPSSGQAFNNGSTLVDLASGDEAEGIPFDEDQNPIFVCSTLDTQEGLGNRDSTASFPCSFDVFFVQVRVSP